MKSSEIAAIGSRGAGPEAWQATRAQTGMATQFVHDKDDYLESDKPDIGRQTGINERELFVSCDPTLALQQQFEHLRPEFIAIHDIGTSASRKLLNGIAAASGRAVQKLVIRRQGYGTALASLDFIELPTTEGGVLRMYSTEADANTTARHGLARMLLAFSRLGVMMVGDLPAHAIASALSPFQAFMRNGPWPNREMLLLPLSSGGTLATQASEIARGVSVNIRTTPQVTRPADAWGFINGTWSRLQQSVQKSGQSIPALARANASTPPRPVRPAATAAAASAPSVPVPRPAPDPLAMRDMPALPSAAERASRPTSQLDRYARQLSELPGMVSCCIFDVNTGSSVIHAGASPGAADLARHGKTLLNGLGASCRAMGLGQALPEVAITLASHHLLLRALPGHPGLALHAAIEKTNANLTLVRLQVERMDAVLLEPAVA